MHVCRMLWVHTNVCIGIVHTCGHVSVFCSSFRSSIRCFCSSVCASYDCISLCSSFHLPSIHFFRVAVQTTAINLMDKKLEKLDTLEKKVCEVDGDMKKLWNFVHDQLKENKDSITKISDRIDTFEFALGTAHEQITQLNSDKKRMQDSILYLQSQSMRNNLVFSGITEDNHENPEATEVKVRHFMVDKLKIAQDIVDGFQLERVHRMGSNSSGTYATARPRNVVAKFLHFKDRETVRRARMNLKGTGYFVNEQFPKEISDRRRELLPKMHQAKRDGKTSWLSYDTLYIDGRPVRSER